jgi:hypothetical protein
MTQEAPKKRGRPAKVEIGALRVKKPESIADGESGFLAVGTRFDAVDAEAAASLIAKGLAE